MKETMEDKKTVSQGTVCQVLTLGLTVLKLFCPQDVLLAGKEVMMDLLVSNLMDPKLIPWIFVLNIAARWVKKLDLPKWMPPLPVLIMGTSFVICSLFGWAHTEAEGTKAMIIMIMDYGIVNGLQCALFAMGGYDIFKGFMSKRKAKGGVKA